MNLMASTSKWLKAYEVGHRVHLSDNSFFVDVIWSILFIVYKETNRITNYTRENAEECSLDEILW